MISASVVGDQSVRAHTVGRIQQNRQYDPRPRRSKGRQDNRENPQPMGKVIGTCLRICNQFRQIMSASLQKTPVAVRRGFSASLFPAGTVRTSCVQPSRLATSSKISFIACSIGAGR